MLRSRSHNNVCEQEARFVQDRIGNVEKYLAELCTIFAALTRKVARLRDKNDEVAKVIQTYAESETVNRSLSNGLINLSTTLSVVGDYRDAQVQRLDAKVIAPLSQYATICKHAREDVKNTFAARDRELARRRQLDRLREKNPKNRQMISQAESDLMKATVEVSKVIKGLEDQIDSFERRKLHDVKTVLLDFIMIELSFYSKGIELLTKAYQDVAEIDETKDLEDFQNARENMNGKFRETLRATENMSRTNIIDKTSFRQAYSLTNLTNRFASSPIIEQKPVSDSGGTIDSTDSPRTVVNSSESIQVDGYEESTEETESESIQVKPMNSSIGKRKHFLIKSVPPIPPSQKLLSSTIRHNVTRHQFKQ